MKKDNMWSLSLKRRKISFNETVLVNENDESKEGCDKRQEVSLDENASVVRYWWPRMLYVRSRSTDCDWCTFLATKRFYSKASQALFSRETCPEKPSLAFSNLLGSRLEPISGSYRARISFFMGCVQCST